MTRRILIGAFAGAHGVRGEAKVKSFTAEPSDIASYGPVASEDGVRRFTLTVLRAVKGDILVVRAPEIRSREDAEALKGVRLYVDRSALPPPAEDEYYVEDLVGMRAETAAGAPAGSVAAVHNFGAGDILELEGAPGVKGTRMIRFHRDTVANVDLDGGVLTLSEDALADDSDESGPEEEAN